MAVKTALYFLVLVGCWTVHASIITFPSDPPSSPPPLNWQNSEITGCNLAWTSTEANMKAYSCGAGLMCLGGTATSSKSATMNFSTNAGFSVYLYSVTGGISSLATGTNKKIDISFQCDNAAVQMWPTIQGGAGTQEVAINNFAGQALRWCTLRWADGSQTDFTDIGISNVNVSCPDANECLINNGNCGSGYTCTNTPGSYMCNDINECFVNNGNCGSGYTCLNSQGGYTCNDINECTNNNGNCGSGYMCNNNQGGFTCDDINECMTNMGNCGSGYTCNNNAGGFTCNDINECFTNNGNCGTISTSTCSNSPAGSFTCGCQSGYAASTTCNGPASCSCMNVNECMTTNGGCGLEAGTVCLDTAGSRTCGCDVAGGYYGSPPGTACQPCNAGVYCATCSGSASSCDSCVMPTGFNLVGHTCVDKNECMTSNGGCGADLCFNTPGSRTCGCPPGTTGSAGNCQDVNECMTNNGDCGVTTAGRCDNTYASHNCTCFSGYFMSGGAGNPCVDINECRTTNGGCGAGALCTNTPGSRTCACLSGYTGSPPSCSDVNECGANNGGCDGSLCTNFAGGYNCSCSATCPGNLLSCTCPSAGGGGGAAAAAGGAIGAVAVIGVGVGIFFYMRRKRASGGGGGGGGEGKSGKKGFEMQGLHGDEEGGTAGPPSPTPAAAAKPAAAAAAPASTTGASSTGGSAASASSTTGGGVAAAAAVGAAAGAAAASRPAGPAASTAAAGATGRQSPASSLKASTPPGPAAAVATASTSSTNPSPPPSPKPGSGSVKPSLPQRQNTAGASSTKGAPALPNRSALAAAGAGSASAAAVSHGPKQTLREVLNGPRDSKAYKAFTNFLKQELSDENIGFYAAVEEYRVKKQALEKSSVLKNPRDLAKALEPDCKSITAKFLNVSDVHHRNVNIPDDVLSRFQGASVKYHNTGQYTPWGGRMTMVEGVSAQGVNTIFDEAQEVVFKLMENDTWPRFIKSDTGRELGK